MGYPINVIVRLDSKGVFKEGFAVLENNLRKRHYTSVTVFSEHFSSVINAALSIPSSDDSLEPHLDPSNKDLAKDAMPDYKYRKALVTRIVKAVKGPFEDALRRESELCQKPFEKELADLDKLLENSLLSRRGSGGMSHLGSAETGSTQSWLLIRGRGSKLHQPNEIMDGCGQGEISMDHAILATEGVMTKRQRPTPNSMPIGNGIVGNSYTTNGSGATPSPLSDDAHAAEPLTPPLSSRSDSHPLSRGGIPWYMEPFDPIGTTVREERWTGRELVRGMSEELSDMDEEELSGLIDGDETEGALGSAVTDPAELAAKAKAKKRKIANARRRRPWG